MNFSEYLSLNEQQLDLGFGVNSSKPKYKVRFHLGEGENKFKWRVENIETKEVQFYSPKLVSLVLENGKLHNQKGGAEKINSGANKTVVSWIMAEKVYVLKTKALSAELYGTRIAYNPSVLAHWYRKASDTEKGKDTSVIPGKDARGNKLENAGDIVINIDKTIHSNLITDGSSIFELKNSNFKKLKSDINKDKSKVIFESVI